MSNPSLANILNTSHTPNIPHLPHPPDFQLFRKQTKEECFQQHDNLVRLLKERSYPEITMPIPRRPLGLISQDANAQPRRDIQGTKFGPQSSRKHQHHPTNMRDRHVATSDRPREQHHHRRNENSPYPFGKENTPCSFTLEYPVPRTSGHRYQAPVPDPTTPSPFHRTGVLGHYPDPRYVYPTITPGTHAMYPPQYTPSPITRTFPKHTPSTKDTPYRLDTPYLNSSQVRAQEHAPRVRNASRSSTIPSTPCGPPHLKTEKQTPLHIRTSGIPRPVAFPGMFPEDYRRGNGVPLENRESVTPAQRARAEAVASGLCPKGSKAGGDRASLNPWDYIIGDPDADGEGSEEEDDDYEDEEEGDSFTKRRRGSDGNEATGKRRAVGDSQGRKRAQKGKRNPQSRRRFSKGELEMLEIIWPFDEGPKTVERQRLAGWFGFITKHVTIWFQNRRQESRRHKQRLGDVEAPAHTPSRRNGTWDDMTGKFRPIPASIIDPPTHKQVAAMTAILSGEVTRDEFLAAYPTPPPPPATNDPRRGTQRYLNANLEDVMRASGACQPERKRLQCEGGIQLIGDGAMRNQQILDVCSSDLGSSTPRSSEETDTEDKDEEVVRHSSRTARSFSSGGSSAWGKLSIGNFLVNCERARVLQSRGLRESPHITSPGSISRRHSGTGRPFTRVATMPLPQRPKPNPLKPRDSFTRSQTQAAGPSSSPGEEDMPRAGPSRGFGRELHTNADEDDEVFGGGSSMGAARRPTFWNRSGVTQRMRDDDQENRNVPRDDENSVMTGQEGGVEGVAIIDDEQEDHGVNGRGVIREKAVNGCALPDQEAVQAAQALLGFSGSQSQSDEEIEARLSQE